VCEDVAVTVVQQESWSRRRDIYRHGISSFLPLYGLFGRVDREERKGDLGGLTIHRQPILVPSCRRPKLAQMEQGHTSEIDPQLRSSPHSPFRLTCAGFDASAQGKSDEGERGEEDPSEDSAYDANAEDCIRDIVMCFVMTSFQRKP
jgi:hypothetical protein